MAISIPTLFAGAVANPVTYDFMKYVGGEALARLRDRGIRRAIFRDTRKRLERYGCRPAQAEHLAQLVEDKQWLERGASLDVGVLSGLVQTEMKERGYLPLEGDVLYRSLVESVASALGGDTFTRSMVVANYLGIHPQPINPGTFFAFVDAMRHPETLGAELLGGILKDAGQHHARLAVNHKQKLELIGPYQLHFRGHGEGGVKLRDAVEQALAGGFARISALHTADITITAGHAVLDRILGLHPGGLTALELRAAPVTRALLIRGRHGAEQTVTVRLQRLPDQHLTLIFVERPDLIFRIEMSADTWDWRFHFDLGQGSITRADRDVLRGIRLLSSGYAQVFDGMTTKHLFAVKEDNADLGAVHHLTGLLVDLLDVDQYIAEHLGERVGLTLDGPLDEDVVRRVAIAAQHARHELVGTTRSHTHQMEMTEVWAGRFRPGHGFWARASYILPYESGTFEVTLDWRSPKVTFRDQRGRKLAQSRLADHVGEIVNLTFSGEVVEASLHREGAGE